MLLNIRQEKFSLEYVASGNATQSAIKAGYSPVWAGPNAGKILKNPNILARISELREEVRSALIADVRERQEILSEIARGNLLDYQATGADGAWLNIGRDSPHTRAIAEIVSKTDEDNSVVTKVKLHNPITAIDILNKMDKIYTDSSPGLQDNRVINITISGGEDAKERLERLLAGEEPGHQAIEQGESGETTNAIEQGKETQGEG